MIWTCAEETGRAVWRGRVLSPLGLRLVRPVSLGQKALSHELLQKENGAIVYEKYTYQIVETV